MIGKTNWTSYLHAIRKREIDLLFSLLPRKHFSSGLEVGAGDGYQTTLLAPHIDKLVSSDLNFKRMKESLRVSGVTYKLVDADAIEGVFPPKTFDFIFSSNVLEHVQNPHTFLTKTEPMLTDDGYAVHVVPSRLVKISYLLFYYPNLVLLVLDRIRGALNGKPFFQGAGTGHENNINTNVTSKKVSRLRRFIFPSPHGNFPSHREEFIAFGKEAWEHLFIKAGYSIVAYAPGPLFSGYGFGLDSIRKVLEYCGASSEHIFICQKMSAFESATRAHTETYLPRGSRYEKEKFVNDWLKKEGKAKAFVDDFRRTVGNPRGKKILDIGFGNGMILLEFAQAEAIAYGVETEDPLRIIAEKQFKENAKKATFVVYDGKTFPFADNFFDYCYSTSVLEHMSYPEEVLREISRTLVPGGRFYLSFPNKYAPKESHTGLWFISWLPRRLAQFILRWNHSSPLEDWNLHFVSFFSLKKMAKKAGLRIAYDTHSSSLINGFIKKMLANFGIHYGILLKTIILVLEKPSNV